MTLWRVRICLGGPALSEWQADTLWGHLCWALRYGLGERALTHWLDRYRDGDPPLLVSDGFPGETLPAPLYPALPVESTPRSLSAAPVDPGARPPMEMRRRATWLTRAEFLASVSAARLVLSDVVASGWERRVAYHNTVSRETGGTLSEKGEGGLFTVVERHAPGSVVTLYARTADRDLGLARDLFESLRHSGYGRRRAVGYGAIEAIEWEPEIELDRPRAGADGFVSLSSFLPQPDDPVDGAWDVRVKYPRFGDDMGGSPWKQPLLLLATGSLFRSEPMRPWYGGLVEGVALDQSSAARRNAVQYAYAFPVPAVVGPALA